MRPEILVATEPELRACMSLDLGTVDTVERAFAALGAMAW